ncbi:MAG: rRNA maturation RNase YbeY [Thermoleophilum sp.]|nr:rRNA maturation RNase YbeY [Thermoleophilum sp.]
MSCRTEIEVFAADGELAERLRAAAQAALEAAGVGDGHLAITLVDRERMRALNRSHRGRDKATDVLSFPVDGSGPTAGPRELGDVVLCPPECEDLVECTVHGVLHLCGYDHETDDGEMFALQERVLTGLRAPRNAVATPGSRGAGGC